MHIAAHTQVDAPFQVDKVHPVRSLRLGVGRGCSMAVMRMGRPMRPWAFAAGVMGCLAPLWAQTITTVAGDGTLAVMPQPAGMAFDTLGHLYFAAFTGGTHHQVIKLDVSTGVLNLVAGKGAYGSGGDGGPAVDAQLNRPFHIGFSGPGDRYMYVTDQSNHRIRRVDTLTGIITTVALPSPVISPIGLLMDGADFAFVTGTNHLVRVQLSTGAVSVVAGDGTAGSSPDGTLATAAQLNGPFGIARDSSGNLYVAQHGGYRVDKIDMTTGRISRVAGTGANGVGAEGILATASPLGGLEDVAVDRVGNVFIAEGGNHRIRMVGLDGKITTVAGTGTRGFLGEGGLPALAQFNDPSGLAFDGDGNLYVADYGNYRIRKITFKANTVTFGAQAGQPAGAPSSFALAPVATGDSSAAVIYRSSTPGVCTVSGTTVSVLSTGTCTVEAVSPGDGVWGNSAAVQRSMRVVGASATPVPALSHVALLLLGGTLGAAAWAARRSARRQH
jgi:sugar lactone lactonase YvrE